MSEPTLHTKICLVSKLILHMKMCNVRTHIAHENMSRVRTYVTSKMCYVRTYATHEYEIIFYPNWWYIRKCVMSGQMLHTNMRFVLSELMLHSKIYMSEIMLHTEIWCLVSELTWHTKMCNVHFSLPFQNLDLGIASADDKLHLAIPMSRSCQYWCVGIILSKYSKKFKR